MTRGRLCALSMPLLVVLSAGCALGRLSDTEARKTADTWLVTMQGRTGDFNGLGTPENLKMELLRWGGLLVDSPAHSHVAVRIRWSEDFRYPNGNVLTPAEDVWRAHHREYDGSLVFQKTPKGRWMMDVSDALPPGWRQEPVEVGVRPPTRSEAVAELPPGDSGTPSLAGPHAAALARWLRQHPELRLLSTRDAPMDPRNIDYFRKEGGGPAYHPCYVVGDVNGDGQTDFAVLLFDKRVRKNQGAIAIFNGPFPPGDARGPALFEPGYQIENWYLWCERKPKFTLYEGLAESGSLSWFVWKNGKYEHAANEEPEPE
jgi:hypothetical protein